MQTPAAGLNIGVDIAKDAIVVACSEGVFPVREVGNQRGIHRHRFNLGIAGPIHRLGEARPKASAIV